MTLIDVDNATEPLVLEKFNIIQPSEYPYCLLGFQLKNSYDQERLLVKSKYKIKDVIHLLPTAITTPACFRGMKLNIKPEFSVLINQIGKFNTSLKSEDSFLLDYKSLLNKYNLTCNDCWGYLKKGVYPIDGNCLNTLSDTKWTLEMLYNDAFVSNVPFFQSFSSFTIFILCNNTIFSGT